MIRYPDGRTAEVPTPHPSIRTMFACNWAPASRPRRHRPRFVRDHPLPSREVTLGGVARVVRLIRRK